MDDRTLAVLAEENLVCAATCWTRSAGGEVWDDGGIVVTSVPASMRSFNQLFVRGPIAEEALPAALGHFGGRGRFRLRAREDIGLDAGMLSRAGLRRRGGIPSMTLESPEGQESAGLDVRSISDETTLGDHTGLVAGAFDWDRHELASVFTPALLADPAWLGWVGYLDNEPVCTAQLVLDGSTAGIYYVATAEQHRGKGYGGLISRRAVDEAARRSSLMVGLQPSPLGRPVYERIGFRVVAEYETYVPV